MAELKISKVVTAVKVVSDGLKINGDYLIVNGQVPKTGKVNVRCAGDYAGATISVGYIDGGVFVATNQPSGSPAAFTSNFVLQFNCGEHTGNAAGPAIQVASIDGTGTTDLSLTISSID